MKFRAPLLTSATTAVVTLLAYLPAVARAEEAASVGFPQLNPSSYASQVFWLAVAFLLLYILMSRLALPRMEEVLDLRKAKRSNALNHAEQLNGEAEKIRKTYERSLEKAQKEAQESLRAAENAIKEKMAVENAQFAEQSRKRSLTAEQKILKARQDALQSLADISADLAAEIALKVANIQLNKADAKKAVSELMQERG